MDNLIGYPLKEALTIIEASGNKIIIIKKIIGTNKKFNNLNNPYVIKNIYNDNSITLFISYY
jgi:hypothetical protein